MKFYIYHHIRPDTGAIFYVGRGKIRKVNPQRCYDTLDRNFGWKQIVKLNKGKFDVLIVSRFKTFEEAERAEIEEIAKYGRENDGSGILCNLTEGGSGCDGFKHRPGRLSEIYFVKNPNRNWHLKDPLYIARRAAKRRGKPSWNKGKKHTEQHVKNMIAGHKNEQKRNARAVVDIATGIIYKNPVEAAEAIGMNYYNLYDRLRGSAKNTTNLRFADAL